MNKQIDNKAFLLIILHSFFYFLIIFLAIKYFTSQNNIIASLILLLILIIPTLIIFRIFNLPSDKKNLAIVIFIILFSLPFIWSIFGYLKGCAGEECMFFWGVIFFVYLSAFFFLLCLSIFFIIYLYKKNYQKMSLSIPIILILILLILNFPKMGCQREDTQCFVQKALEKNDYSICLKSFDVFECQIGLLEITKDLDICYISETTKVACFHRGLRINKDPSFCKKLADENIMDINSCYNIIGSSIAEGAESISECENISVDEVKRYCKLYLNLHF